MIPAISVFTCSYNKPQYVGDAIQSVLAQTCGDWEYFILENSTDNGVTKAALKQWTDPRMRVVHVEVTDWERRKRSVESLLKNNYAKLATGKYLFHLADDDVLDPDCFAAHLEDFATHPDHRLNYHHYRIDPTEYDPTLLPKVAVTTGKIWPADGIFRPGESAKTRVDGGSVMFERSILSELDPPWWKLIKGDAHIADGLFLNHTKRITPLTTHREAYGRDIGTPKH
jgi:glycosyltransferase involved in cell wall biosynthesis